MMRSLIFATETNQQLDRVDYGAAVCQVPTLLSKIREDGLYYLGSWPNSRGVTISFTEYPLIFLP